MAVFIFFVAAVSAVIAAPPERILQHPSQVRHLNQYFYYYYLDSPEETYYHREDRRANSSPNAPARLETLEPDSEVELIPGAQPQQPPQQTPVQPNIPGLVPGQRVFIVHMPIPGIRPGTIGGYQPVYVVAAAPQANAAYPGYPASPGQPAAGHITPGYPNLVFSGNAYNRGYGLAPPGAVYYQQLPAQQFLQVAPSAVNFAQLVALQGQPAQAAEEVKPSAQNAEQKGASQVTIDSKESAAEQNRNEKSSQRTD